MNAWWNFLVRVAKDYYAPPNFPMPLARPVAVKVYPDIVKNAEKWRALSQWPKIQFAPRIHPKILKPYRAN